jgi:hypothetical protein
LQEENFLDARLPAGCRSHDFSREKTMMKATCYLSFALLLSLVSIAPVSAAPVLIDFTSGVGDNFFAYDESGFRVRPQLNDHFERATGCTGAAANGWFCWHDSFDNIAPNIITVDYSDGSGNPFFVSSVDITSLVANVGDTGGIVFSDSNGNSVQSNSLGTLALNFSNTTFLKFQIVNMGVNSFPIAIDNLSLDTDPFANKPVPEPATLLLMGFGFAALGVARRKRA